MDEVTTESINQDSKLDGKKLEILGSSLDPKVPYSKEQKERKKANNDQGNDDIEQWKKDTIERVNYIWQNDKITRERKVEIMKGLIEDELPVTCLCDKRRYNCIGYIQYLNYDAIHFLVCYEPDCRTYYVVKEA